MAKDFTDYIIMVLDSGERVYHLVHLRNAKGCKIDGNIYPMNDHKYLLNLDRAYRINWAPWKKLVVKKPYWRNFYKPLIELTRSKKIGLLIYQEPELPIIVEDRIPIRWLCSACDFETESASGIKIHMSAKHDGTIKPPEVVNKIVKRTIAKPEPISPMHISRIHQPSGVMKG